jgi:hypothetical protein
MQLSVVPIKLDRSPVEAVLAGQEGTAITVDRSTMFGTRCQVRGETMGRDKSGEVDRKVMQGFIAGKRG